MDNIIVIKYINDMNYYESNETNDISENPEYDENTKK